MADWRIAALLSAATVAFAGTQPATAPVELTIPQAAARSAPDQTPLHEGRLVTVTGIVSGVSIPIINYAHLGIHDGNGHGMTVEAAPEKLRGLDAADRISVTGVISHRAGLPVVVASELHRVSRAAPAPIPRVRPSALFTPQYLGLWVVTEGVVVESGANTGGDYLLIGENENPLKVFLPQSRWGKDNGLLRFERGDKVQVTGLASQFCPRPPYDRMYQVVVPGVESVTLLERSWLIPPRVVAFLALILGTMIGFWWLRERRLSVQRQNIRLLNKVGEDVLSAESPADILETLTAKVPPLLRVTDVHLYIFRPATRSLERIAGRHGDGAGTHSSDPETGIAPAAAAAFRNRALLAISDTSRSSLFTGGREDLPRSAMFVPMLAQNEPMGVLALCHARQTRSFNQDEQAAAQHFGNQIAASLKLLEQRTVREQLFRSEKLAATGQLISGIVDQLEAPLESIMTLAGRTLSRPADTETKRLLAAIASEARRASEIVSRLMSLARAEKGEAKPVEINSLLSSLMEFLASKWDSAGIQVTNRLAAEPVYILGSQGQLEQVFLNLFVHAELSLANAEQRQLYISTSLLARRVLIAISYTGPESAHRRDPFVDPEQGEAGELGLGVCRAIIQSHSGEIRFNRSSGNTSRFEVELPVVPARGAGDQGADPSSGRWTVLVLESDPVVQRQLLVQLSAKGSRVIPASRTEDAVAMTEKIRFDVVFCAVRMPAGNWLEFFERVRPKVGAFVLMTEGVDADLAGAFQTGDGFVLRKPFNEDDLSRLVAGIESRAEHDSSR